MVILLPCYLSTVTGKVLHKTGWRLFTIYRPHLSHHTCSINRKWIMCAQVIQTTNTRGSKSSEDASPHFEPTASDWSQQSRGFHLFNLLVTFHPNIKRLNAAFDPRGTEIEEEVGFNRRWPFSPQKLEKPAFSITTHLQAIRVDDMIFKWIIYIYSGYYITSTHT